MTELPLEVDVHHVQKLLSSNEDFLLLDVREENEYAVAMIDGSTLLPMSQIRDRLSELEPHREKLIVVHCHHGGRSMQVTQALRSQGFTQVQNMAGGIDDWSQQIDPTVPRY
ncbi:MAG: rhodanese-like domain-containing protein [Planctomycetota bacterium]